MIKRCIKFTEEEFKEVQQALRGYMTFPLSHDSALKEIIFDWIRLKKETQTSGGTKMNPELAFTEWDDKKDDDVEYEAYCELMRQLGELGY